MAPRWLLAALPLAALAALAAAQGPVADAPCDKNLSVPAPDEPVSGTQLFCYECKETYVKKYDPWNSPCRHNLSAIAVRRCGPTDRYCKVERLDLHSNVLSIERSCVKDCPYGCRFNGYGLTYMRCTSCCRTYGCNDGNAAAPARPDPLLAPLLPLLLLGGAGRPALL